MTEITSLSVARAERENNNSLLTPVECLTIAVREIENGERKCQSILVITLNRGDDNKGFGVGFYASNLKASDQLALIEVMKAFILTDMGYIPER